MVRSWPWPLWIKVWCSLIDNCRVIMNVFFLNFNCLCLLFTILAPLSIFAIVVTCIFYVLERMYFNLRSSCNNDTLQLVLVSYDLLLLYQILRLTSNFTHMRLITNHLALLNNIWKRKMILYVTCGILYTVYLLTDAIDEAVNVDELKHNVCVLVI